MSAARDIAVASDRRQPAVERALAVRRMGAAADFTKEAFLESLLTNTDEEPEVRAAVLAVLINFWARGDLWNQLCDLLVDKRWFCDDPVVQDGHLEALSVASVALRSGRMGEREAGRVRDILVALASDERATSMQQFFAYSAYCESNGWSPGRYRAGWERDVDSRFPARPRGKPP